MKHCALPLRTAIGTGAFIGAEATRRAKGSSYRIGLCSSRIADCGLRIADCGLRIADCGCGLTQGRTGPRDEIGQNRQIREIVSFLILGTLMPSACEYPPSCISSPAALGAGISLCLLSLRLPQTENRMRSVRRPTVGCSGAGLRPFQKTLSSSSLSMGEARGYAGCVCRATVSDIGIREMSRMNPANSLAMATTATQPISRAKSLR